MITNVAFSDSITSETLENAADLSTATVAAAQDSQQLLTTVTTPPESFSSDSPGPSSQLEVNHSMYIFDFQFLDY